MFVFE